MGFQLIDQIIKDFLSINIQDSLIIDISAGNQSTALISCAEKVTEEGKL